MPGASGEYGDRRRGGRAGGQAELSWKFGVLHLCGRQHARESRSLGHRRRAGHSPNLSRGVDASVGLSTNARFSLVRVRLCGARSLSPSPAYYDRIMSTYHLHSADQQMIFRTGVQTVHVVMSLLSSPKILHLHPNCLEKGEEDFKLTFRTTRPGARPHTFLRSA